MLSTLQITSVVDHTTDQLLLLRASPSLIAPESPPGPPFQHRRN